MKLGSLASFLALMPKMKLDLIQLASVKFRPPIRVSSKKLKTDPKICVSGNFSMAIAQKTAGMVAFNVIYSLVAGNTNRACSKLSWKK